MCVFLLLFQSYRSVRSGSLRTLHQKHIYNQPNYTQNCRAQFNSTHRSVFTMSSDFTHTHTHTPATRLMKQMYRKICTQTHIYTHLTYCVFTKCQTNYLSFFWVHDRQLHGFSSYIRNLVLCFGCFQHFVCIYTIYTSYAANMWPPKSKWKLHENRKKFEIRKQIASPSEP